MSHKLNKSPKWQLSDLHVINFFTRVEETQIPQSKLLYLKRRLQIDNKITALYYWILVSQICIHIPDFQGDF